MAGSQKVVPFLPSLQTLFLLSLYPYSLIVGKFAQVFDGMNIELPPLSRFLLYPPGLYTYHVVVLSLFGFYLWLWRKKRLGGRLALILRGVYLTFIVLMSLWLFFPSLFYSGLGHSLEQIG